MFYSIKGAAVLAMLASDPVKSLIDGPAFGFDSGAETELHRRLAQDIETYQAILENCDISNPNLECTKQIELKKEEITAVRQQADDDGKFESQGTMNKDPNAPDEINRALLPSNMGLINNYGCWCYFTDSVGKGKARPVDAIDTFCKTLHDGYMCILMDSADPEESDEGACVPWEIGYNSAIGSGAFPPFGLTKANLNTECDRVNPGNFCGAATCKVEGYFVQSYFTYAIFGGLIDITKRHENGFDPALNCATPTGTGPSEEACCGHYPERIPYRYNGDNRDCCIDATGAGHVFNPSLFFCCDDGNVRLSC